LQATEASAATKDHAAQVVNLLVHEGFLRAERGRGGGIALAVPATEILLGDVLRRIQPDLVRHAGRDDLSGHRTTIPAFAAVVGAVAGRQAGDSPSLLRLRAGEVGSRDESRRLALCRRAGVQIVIAGSAVNAGNGRFTYSND
jgi:hypothetical protein